MKNVNKYSHTVSSASLDIWESQYLKGGYVMKKNAKRTSKRANRQLSKAIIREQLNG